MQRNITEVRPAWQETVESQGMYFHTVDGIPYWDESVYYEFTPQEVDVLEAATYELNRICLEAVQHVIDEDRFDQFLIPKEFRQYIRDSWENDEHTIYGRFDLVYDGNYDPKMLEYNADTPTGLLEAAVGQWYWLKDKFPQRNQFNSIHERLIEAWKAVKTRRHGLMYFTALGGHIEDYMTVNYLRDTATQAGWETAYIDIENIGWHPTRLTFTDLDENEIVNCFKLYPWEWMQREQLASGAGTTLNAIAQACKEGVIEGRIYAVITNKRQCGAVKVTKDNGLFPCIIPERWRTEEEHSEIVLGSAKFCRPDLVICAGYIRKLIVTPEWEGRILNIHPSLLPKHGGKGMYGHHVYKAVLSAKEPWTGCTVHVVDNEYDHGLILAQSRVMVREGDTSVSLASRVQEVERVICPQAIQSYLGGKWL